MSTPNLDDGLAAEAQAFARRLSDTVSGFLGRTCPFTADAIPSGRFSVTDQDAAGITLTASGLQVLSLEINYECSWDSSGEYLAVHKSKVAVHAGPRPTGKQVLFRYEYVRGQGRDLPSAHLHVHAHRDAFAHVMSTAGRNAADAKARLMGVLGDVPRLSAFHFPVGGHRFRPCLEDVLAVLRQEFAIDVAPGWREVLDEGRLVWRRQQVAAAVRDCPDEAVRALAALGYVVSLRQGTDKPSENRSRMTSL